MQVDEKDGTALVSNDIGWVPIDALITKQSQAQETCYFVDNRALQAPTQGLGYRFEKNISSESKCKDGRIADWDSIVKGNMHPDDWLEVVVDGKRLFLPAVVSGTRVLTEVMERSFLVDNSLLQDPTKGLGYRTMKDMNQKVQDDPSIVPWGKIVRGIDEGDGWLRVESYGETRFLPMMVRSMRVITEVSEEAQRATEQREDAYSAGRYTAEPEQYLIEEENLLSPRQGRGEEVNADLEIAYLAPAWTRGEIERPTGLRDMGSYSESVYTTEQQQRLGVDEKGNPSPAKANVEPAATGYTFGESGYSLGDAERTYEFAYTSRQLDVDGKGFAAITQPGIRSSPLSPEQPASPEKVPYRPRGTPVPSSPQEFNISSRDPTPMDTAPARSAESAPARGVLEAAPARAADALSARGAPEKNNASMEAARLYAVRNADFARCLAEITADLQRACIISSPTSPVKGKYSGTSTSGAGSYQSGSAFTWDTAGAQRSGARSAEQQRGPVSAPQGMARMAAEAFSESNLPRRA